MLEVEKTTSWCPKWTICDFHKNLQLKFQFKYFSRAGLQALEKKFFSQI